MSLGEREDELLDTLEAVIDADLPYVLVGGLAIAAFNQGFITDVDIESSCRSRSAGTRSSALLVASVPRSGGGSPSV